MKGISERPSGVVLGMIMSTGEVGMKIIADLRNHIIADWELSAIVYCYKRNEDAL